MVQQLDPSFVVSQNAPQRKKGDDEDDMKAGLHANDAQEAI